MRQRLGRGSAAWDQSGIALPLAQGILDHGALADVVGARARWLALTRYIDDGRLEISNNAVENAIQPLALGRKNDLFAGSDAGGKRAAHIYILIRTAELNGLEPEAYLADVLTRIGEHSINRVDELLPWTWKPAEGPTKIAA